MRKGTFAVLKQIVSLMILIVPFSSHGAICSAQGKVTKVLSSEAEAGMWVESSVPEGCSCAVQHGGAFLTWIDMDLPKADSLFSAAITARVSQSSVVITFQDGTGEGHPDNGSIAHRYFSDCKVTSIEF